MKFINFSLFILLLNNPLNCTCVYNVNTDYYNFDTIFRAEVLSVSYLNSNKYNQKAKLKITKVYKGNPTSTIITVEGGCSTPKLISNKEWIFFTSNKNNTQTLKSCNPSIRLYPKSFIENQPKRLKISKLRLERNLKLLDSLSRN
ncbi:hypothetical protein [Winogradskyella forsetii]|uniref:hypothetical protein n=1 Tax=Winogradskyella forsetii TaxID=2686077 RepID=UPI0015C0407D|nr:hypothetical protein [Winogradskyella forsetii]